VDGKHGWDRTDRTDEIAQIGWNRGMVSYASSLYKDTNMLFIKKTFFKYFVGVCMVGVILATLKVSIRVPY
jgi:hypothetical protein